MKGWIRLAIVLSVFWVIGCGVVLMVELSQLPQPRNNSLHKPAFEVFFQSTKIPAVYVRHPHLGLNAFPSDMTRQEIEDAFRRNLPKSYEPTNEPIEWNVTVDTPTNYYRITFDGQRCLRIAIFPAVAIFVAALAAGCGTRWVVRGFKQ